MKKKKNTLRGVCSWDLLTIAFIVLKLLEKIDWPWVWVLAPTWISLSIILVCAIATHIMHKKIDDLSAPR